MILNTEKETLFLPLIYLANTLIFWVKVILLPSKCKQQTVVCCMANPSRVGGTELQFKLISSNLMAHGLARVVLTLGKVKGGSSNQTIAQLKQNQLLHLSAGILTRINYEKYPVLQKWMTHILRRFNTPILHLFKPSSASLIRAAKEAGMRIVYTETGLPENNRVWAQLVPYIHDLDHVISVSEVGLDQLREKFGYQGPGTIINSMIETPSAACQSRAPQEGSLNLIYFGRMVDGKGIDFLLQAFALILPLYPYACLTLIGEGRDLRRIKRLTAELNLEKNIRFFDFLGREKLFEKIADSDLFCLPSLSEGCPCSIIEVMAVGLPVIATRVGGIPELVVHQETGLLVPKRDAEALAQAIQHLAANPNLRVKMGREGQKRYHEKFAKNVAIEKLISVYQTLC